MNKLRRWFWAEIRPSENSAQTLFRIFGNFSRWFITFILLLIVAIVIIFSTDKILQSTNPVHKLDILISYSPSPEYLNPAINISALRSRFPAYKEMSNNEFFQKLYEQYGEGLSETDFSRAVKFEYESKKEALLTSSEDFDTVNITREQAISEIDRRKKISRLIELRIKKQLGDGPWWNYEHLSSDINVPTSGSCPKFSPILISIENKSNKPLEKISLQLEARKKGRSTNLIGYSEGVIDWDYIIDPKEKVARCFKVDGVFSDQLIWSIKPRHSYAVFNSD